VNHRPAEATIIAREGGLREWFTRGCDPTQRVVDGLDVGWGGVQRWATARMPSPAERPHLDVACGYATFLAQLGWRFPTARLVGFNIDFDGPHALARPLLTEAGVVAALVQADGRRMPFADDTFGSASCFLGLQDIEIGFGEEGIQETVAESARILCPNGVLTLLDEFPFERFDSLLDGLPVVVVDRKERALNVQWDRQVAEQAIALYVEGWIAQTRTADRTAQEQTRVEVHRRMAAEMERQLDTQGYYVPFGPVRMVLARKVRQEREIRR
jgi:ubiquinone/menaquinone biosynthesis C-methylase UbiE